jgi:calcineurin-like phosphoesterase family protein
MKSWVTSDHHFLHNNILNICKRPFQTVDEMNEKLIENWNSVVKNGDIVYYLGDFAIEKHNMANALVSLTEILSKLKGKKILVKGNHDELYLDLYRDHFHNMIDYFELMINKKRIVMCHYPFEEWRDKYKNSIHLHGHSHGNSSKVENRYDVGVDTNNFQLYNLEYFLDYKAETDIN